MLDLYFYLGIKNLNFESLLDFFINDAFLKRIIRIFINSKECFDKEK